MSETRPEVREFLKARGRATRALFDSFIAARGLDVDQTHWSSSDRSEYATAAKELVEEWKGKQVELLRSLSPDTTEGDES